MAFTLLEGTLKSSSKFKLLDGSLKDSEPVVKNGFKLIEEGAPVKAAEVEKSVNIKLPSAESVKKFIPDTKISAAPEPTIFDRIKSFYPANLTKENMIDELSKDFDLSHKEVSQNFDQIARKKAMSTGVATQPTNEEFLNGVMTATIPLSASILGPMAVLKGVAGFMAVKEGSERAALPAAKAVWQALNKEPVKYEVTKLRELFPDIGPTQNLADLSEFLIYGAGAKGIGDILKIPRVAGEMAGFRYRVLKTLGVKNEAVFQKFGTSAETALVPLNKEQMKAAFGEGAAARMSPEIFKEEAAKRGPGTEEAASPAAKPPKAKEVPKPEIKLSPEATKQEKQPYKDFKIQETMDQPKSSLMQRADFMTAELEKTNAPLTEKLSQLQEQLDDTEHLDDRAKLTNEISVISVKIKQSQQNLQTKLNDDAEAAVQSIMDYAGASGIKWPKIRQAEFRQALIEKMTDEATPEETTPREVADELISQYNQVDLQRKAAPKKPKTVIGYIKASGGISNESIEASGYTIQDFHENGAKGITGGKQKFDQMAKEMVEEGIVAEVPGQSPMETVLTAIKERRKMLTKQDKEVDNLFIKNQKELAEAEEEYARAKEAGKIVEGDNPEPSVEEIGASEAEGTKEADSGADGGGEQSIIPGTEAKFPDRKISPNDKNLIQDKKREGELFQEKESAFYSALERAVEEKMPNSASAEQVRGILKNSGVKQDEMDWLDIEGFLKDKSKVTKQELLNYIKSNDVKVEEVEKSSGSYEIKEGKENGDDVWHIVENGNVTETFESESMAEEWIREARSEGATKFHQYQLPGGENYKELLLTLPGKVTEYQPTQSEIDDYINEATDQLGYEISKEEATDALIGKRTPNLGVKTFQSSHFDEPNVLAHIRFNDRTDSEGKKVLFIEEIQSDWHQKGRKEGYQGKTPSRLTETQIERMNELRREGEQVRALNDAEQAELLKLEALAGETTGGHYNVKPTEGVPNAPFKKTWHELALKRMLRYAAENGFDKIAWTTGEQQNERYDLSKQVNSISYQKRSDGTFNITADPIDVDASEISLGNGIPAKELEAKVGKDVAQKIVNQSTDQWQTLEGGDLKVGGEGMKGFYDQIIPSFLNKYTKKWGGRVAKSKFDTGEPDQPWVVRDSTDEGDNALLGSFKTKEAAKAFEKEMDGGTSMSYELSRSIAHSLELTPSMKSSVIEGQPLFQELSKDKPSTFAIEETKLNALLQRNSIKDVVIALAAKIETPSGKGAHGVYIVSQKKVEMTPDPMQTTGYHEGFHAILREAGLLDRIPQLYDEIGTDNPKTAEEILADQFAEYANKRDTFGGKLKSFFEKIMRFIREMLGRRTRADLKTTLFDEMYTGNYRPKQKARAPASESLYQEKDNPIFATKTKEQAAKVKALQAELKQVVSKIKLGGKGYEARRDFLINELNRELSPKNETEATQELKKFIGQLDFFDSELPPGGKPILGGIDPKKLRDLTGIEAAARDVYRNFKDVFGSQFAAIEKELLDPLDKSRGRFVDMQRVWLEELDKTVVQKLGIKASSKESAAVQEYGEGHRDYDSLVKEFGKQKADNIVEADAWFRAAYNDLIGRINSSIAKIYPGQSDKLIPFRKQYYRHFREFSNLAGLMNIFDTPANIASKLAGISEHTKPLSKWMSMAQQRLGIQTDIDAVKGFLDYLPAAAYATHISPNISRFRTLAKELRVSTVANPDDTIKIENLYESRRLSRDPLEKDAIQGRIDDISRKNYLNNFIAFLDDFAGALAGKTNPYFDRVFSKLLGRKTMTVINWVNSRVKANVILANASTAVSQVANIPMAIGQAKLYSFLGAGDSIAQIFKKSPEMEKSTFLKTRYADSMYDKFDRGWVADVIPYPVKLKNATKWFLIVLDEISTRFIWNSLHEEALGKKMADPIAYADKMTRRMVAGRSVGEVPLIQQSKTFQLLAPFMVEVQNLNWELGGRIKDKDFSALVVFMIMAWLLNNLFEEVKGNRVIIDPIDAAIDAFSGDKAPEQRMGRLIGEILSNVPGGYLTMGFYPEYGAKIGDYQLPTRKQFFGEETVRLGKGLLVQQAITDPLFKLLPPFGGNQVKKTIQGNEALSQGYVMHGKKKIEINDNFINRLVANLFGKYSMPEVREYFKNRMNKSQRNYMEKRGGGYKSF